MNKPMTIELGSIHAESLQLVVSERDVRERSCPDHTRYVFTFYDKDQETKLHVYVRNPIPRSQFEPMGEDEANGEISKYQFGDDE